MGGGRSLIEGPITPTLISFSMPLLGVNMLQSLSATVGAIWVSHVLGPAALTATVNAQILMMLLMSAVMGVGMASNIVIAQAFGAGDMSQLKRVAGTSMGFFIISSVLLGIIGTLLTPLILDAMHTPAEAREEAIVYLRYTFMTLPAVFVFMFTTMMMRGSGDARTPFYFSLVAIAGGLIFPPLFLTGSWGFPNMGIAGVVVGGFVANMIALVALLRYMYRSNSPLALEGVELRLLIPNPHILKVLFLSGMPMGVQMLIMSGASIVMLAMVNDYGSNTAAAYGAAAQLWGYVQMPAMAIAASVSSMAAQNIGAGRWDRVNQLAGISCLVAFAFTGAAVLSIHLLGEWPMRLFLKPGEALDIAMALNRIVLWSWVPFAVTFTLFGIVRANSAILPPTIILTITLWALRIPFAEALQPMLGRDAIWWSFPVGTVSSALLAFAYYRWGGWRKNTLMMAFAAPGMTRHEAVAISADTSPTAAAVTEEPRPKRPLGSA